MELEEYISRETNHASKEVVKEVLPSTISITLNANGSDDNKPTASDYSISLRNMMVKVDSSH